ncbi:hypothetical protein ANN_26312 [Periplaneta americana]|uniref:Uncharacterized protein n=1 Tax=Periplaneta americana TaxID=6978 RepID=A0ABQ8S5X5_PERAM|nr:hypothetical protein ANN_26312 [Periplaneta americana]
MLILKFAPPQGFQFPCAPSNHVRVSSTNFIQRSSKYNIKNNENSVTAAVGSSERAPTFRLLSKSRNIPCATRYCEPATAGQVSSSESEHCYFGTGGPDLLFIFATVPRESEHTVCNAVLRARNSWASEQLGVGTLLFRNRRFRPTVHFCNSSETGTIPYVQEHVRKMSLTPRSLPCPYHDLLNGAHRYCKLQLIDFNGHEKPLHAQKVTVWCAASSTGIIDPSFFENEAGNALTVNSVQYVEMIQNFFTQQFGLFSVNENTLFQQDGATSHTARISMDAVNALFPGRVISRKGDIAWPPRSPDLMVCGFFLWGHLKTKMFGGNPPRTIPALKQCIREEVAAIPVNMLRGAMQQFVARLEECVRFNGGHLADVIFKKYFCKHSKRKVSDENVELLLNEAFQRSRKSIRQASVQLNIPPTTVHTVLHKRLRLGVQAATSSDDYAE